jgi:hypothetical protein
VITTSVALCDGSCLKTFKRFKLQSFQNKMTCFPWNSKTVLKYVRWVLVYPPLASLTVDGDPPTSLIG